MLTFYLSMVQTEEDKNKITYIYEKFYPFMCYTAKQYLNNIEDVQDVVHSSIVKIIENIDKIDMSNERRARNLCGIVARNKAIDYRRLKANNVLELEDTYEIPHLQRNDTESIVISRDTYFTVVKEIKKLKLVYRDVCMLKYVYELKEREIAAILGLSANVVNQRIFRGKQELRKALRKEKIHD